MCRNNKPFFRFWINDKFLLVIFHFLFSFHGPNEGASLVDPYGREQGQNVEQERAEGKSDLWALRPDLRLNQIPAIGCAPAYKRSV